MQWVRNLISGTVDARLPPAASGQARACRQARPGAGLFASSITGTPGFADPATHNHAPGPGSAMFDGGACLTRTVGDGQGAESHRN